MKRWSNLQDFQTFVLFWIVEINQTLNVTSCHFICIIIVNKIINNIIVNKIINSYPS